MDFPGISPSPDWAFQIPALVRVSVGLFLALLLAGWIGSSVAGLKCDAARRMRLFLIFPLTHPFALIAFLFMNWRAALPGLLCHVLAFVALLGGGALAEVIERRNLDQYMTRVRQAGGSFSVDSLRPQLVPDESNVWMHPFLEPLARAANSPEAYREALENSRHERMGLPYSPDPGIDYPRTAESSNPTGPYGDPFRPLHETTLTVILDRDGILDEENIPQSWADCGRTIVEHYRPMDADFAELIDAVNRPSGHYPFAWENVPDMLFPHLSQLQSFTQSAALRTEAHASLGQSEAALRNARLGLNLIQADDTDLIICRLVQIAQTVIVLESIRVGQQFHIWNDEQWTAIEDALEPLHFPARIPDAFRGERVFASESVQPMFALRPSELVARIEQTANPFPNRSGTADWPEAVKATVDTLLHSHFQAVFVRDWRRSLQGYEALISASQQALEAMGHRPWTEFESLLPSHDLESYGVSASRIVPSLERSFERSIRVQLHIELARVAIALERYYLEQGRYPDTIEALTPRYLAESPIDPMKDEPWKYKRDGDNGFTLYSVGMNGRDDGGLHTRADSRVDSANTQDDIAWLVQSEPPPLPVFTYRAPEADTLEDALRNMAPNLLRRDDLEPPSRSGRNASGSSRRR